MNLPDLIRTRRTVEKFAPTPLDPAQLVDWLDTAVYAPNHHLTEPWRFVVLVGAGVHRYAEARRTLQMEKMKLDDPDVREQAGQGTYQKFAVVPAYVFAIQQLADDEETRDEDYAALSAIMQNFLLLTWDAGVGTAWKSYKDHPLVRDLLDLQPNERVIGIIHIGYPATEAAAAKPRTAAHLKTTVMHG